MTENIEKGIADAKEKLDKAFTQFIDGAIFASELQARVIDMLAWTNAFIINQDVENVGKE